MAYIHVIFTTWKIQEVADEYCEKSNTKYQRSNWADQCDLNLNKPVDVVICLNISVVLFDAGDLSYCENLVYSLLKAPLWPNIANSID